jgi:hypothetical protein
MKQTEIWMSPQDVLPLANSGVWILFICDDEIKIGTFEKVRGINYFIDNKDIKHATDRISFWMNIPKTPGESDE